MPVHPGVANPYTISLVFPHPPLSRTLSLLYPFTLTARISLLLCGKIWTSAQLTWMVLPQGLRDSPHFCSPALATDLAATDLQPSTLIQYVDDLFCSPAHASGIPNTATLFNFLSDWGYRVSPTKAQIASPKVKY